MKHLKLSITAIVMTLTMIFSLTACGGTNSSSDESSKVSSTKTTMDREGKEIEIPKAVDKIISTAPSITEVLTGLGLTDKIIAADTFSSDAGVDASIATIDMMNINIEKIISLKPQVVFINGISAVGADDPYNALKDAGITVIYIPSASSLQDIMDDISFISAYTKTDSKGEEMVNNIKDTMSELKKIGDTITEKKSVYYEVSAAPYCYSLGTDTYINEIIDMVGAKNIFADQNGWLSVTEESVISANPDIILTSLDYDGYDYKEILSRAGWNSTSAVKNNQVFKVPTNSTSRASQNIVDGMKAIAKAIYPDKY